MVACTKVSLYYGTAVALLVAISVALLIGFLNGFLLLGEEIFR
jgi:ribose/xylose/arabinose/galactoside ABC-type transport system permease subunit